MDKNLDSIIQKLKQYPTNEERVRIIKSLPEDIRLQLLYYFDEIYIEHKPLTNGFKILRESDKRQGNPSLFSVLSTLSDSNKIEFFKKQSDLLKLRYFEFDYYASPDVILALIDSTDDFAYKLIFAEKLECNKNLRIQKLKEIGAKESFLYYTEKIGSKPSFITNKTSSNNRKYREIGLPKDMTFGIEIECLNREYACFLRNNWHPFSGTILGPWRCEADRSIDESSTIVNDLYPSLECVSKPLHDYEDNIEQIYEMCSLLKDLGSDVNESCGGHGHIGRNYLETPQQLWNVIEIYGSCDEVMNLIVNAPNSLPRNSLNKYAKSTYKMLIAKGFDVTKYDTVGKCAKAIKNLQVGKFFDINISIHGTLEFRGPNGTINPDIWIENLKLLGNLMVASKGLETGSLDNIEQKREIFSRLGLEDDVSKKCDMLLDLLFDDEKDKRIYRDRFDKNRALQFKMQDYRELYLSQEHNLNEKSVLEGNDGRDGI